MSIASGIEVVNARLRGVAWIALLVLAGCGNLRYYARAAEGQVSLWKRARPISECLEDRATSPTVRAKLLSVLAIRDFASRDLGLPDNASYRTFADIGRPYAVWNVYAAPELSVKPKEWCFPVAGCVSYRGYFSEAEAQRFAQDLRSEGLDVYVGGVPAYSTLGWFDDPVLSSFVHYSDGDLASLIFHELAHQVAYVRDDTVFNESFATAVELEGMRRWLREAGPEQAHAYEAAQQRRRGFRDLMLAYRARLEAFYVSDRDAEEKREGKRRIFSDLVQDYGELKASWGGYQGYDGWFSRQLNNAPLASIHTYTQLVPTFEGLLERCGGNLAMFYAAVRGLARLPKEERLARLASASPVEDLISKLPAGEGDRSGMDGG
jgi:predicted aminopeptidase